MNPNVRILLVEDVDTDAELTEREVRKSIPAYTMRRVETREAFLAALANDPPDIIISDYLLPTFDGMTALKLAREHAPLTPVIIVTGAINEDTAVECMKSGAVDYVIKEHLKRLGPAILSGLEQKQQRIARMKAEDDLRKSEERYRRFFDNDLSAVYLSTPAGDLLACNPAMVRIMGYGSAEELLQTRSDRLYRSIGERDVFLAELRTKRILQNRETELVRKDGSVISVIENVVGIFEDGRLVEFMGYMFDITERKAAEEKLRTSLREKEALLREVHHRVKNNLQVISSLLHMQSTYAADDATRSALKESEDRVRAMGLVHGILYQTNNFGAIDFGAYVRSMLTVLLQSFGRQEISTSVDSGSIELPMDMAVPCGLILNELVTNSLKHAFPDDRKGTLEIVLRRCDDKMIELSVRDDGVGFPAEKDFQTAQSMGLLIVQSLAQQLGGTLSMESGTGTKFVVRFPPE